MDRCRANQTCNESDGSTRGIETHPNLVESLYGGNGAEKNTVDGGGDLRRGRTGDDGDDPEIRATAAGDLGAKRFEEIIARCPQYIYPHAVGETELKNSVTPKCITAVQLRISVTPRFITRFHRDET